MAYLTTPTLVLNGPETDAVNALTESSADREAFRDGLPGVLGEEIAAKVLALGIVFTVNVGRESQDVCELDARSDSMLSR